MKVFPSPRRRLTGHTLALACVLSLALNAAEPGFESIFDGSTLKGWHVSAKTGHSRASGNTSGGAWAVRDGAITGTQDIPGNGGIILTDQEFGDFEVALEMNNDYGPDSGLFLRSTEDGKAWQAMIDYHANGNLMGIYGEGLGGKPSVRNFSFLEKVTEIVPIPAPTPLPVLPSAWPSFWRHGQWNELRARIVGNPPSITTWINGVKMMEWKETELRHPERGRIALQVHGGGDHTREWVRYRHIRVKSIAPDNALTPVERREGWQLLFDGKSHAGWMNSDRSAPRTPVQEGSLNPHRAGHYMLVHTQAWSNFTLSLDFKLSQGCNSGIFIRTSSLTPRPGKDIGFNGIEIALDDTPGAGFHDTGALYDLVKPARNAMKPSGEWNHVEITAAGSSISVNLNGERVTQADLAQFKTAHRRPDGSPHKFDVAYRDHSGSGFIGLQDHGAPCWFKNIKIKPLPSPIP
ncbi:MAG: DUF1080 domain-containing protein [Verrucomicrobia bacterium]|nr:DUF1080 domain-containing protein [Verrucomicrobiota bacterium]